MGRFYEVLAADETLQTLTQTIYGEIVDHLRRTSILLGGKP